MIQQREQLADTRAHEVALDSLTAGIAAADPARLTRSTVSLAGSTLRMGETTVSLEEYDEIIVLGGGKAAAVVAKEIESVLGERLDGGIVVTDTPVETDCVEILPGDHPMPSQRGVESTRQLLEQADAADEETLVVSVITGGGSALLAAPAEGISLGELQSTTQSLLDSGATIDEINAVRKHLSAIKGGQLAASTAPGRICGLILSDVVGDELATIASGPFVADASTYREAQRVIERYDCQVPEAVVRRLQRGVSGRIDETPGVDDPVFDRVSTTLLGDNGVAVRAAAEAASEAGFEPLILSSQIRGESREAAKTQVAVAEETRLSGHPVEPPVAIVSGGETTVTVSGGGTGGPNGEFVVSAGVELDEPKVVVAAVDTDGIDGITDAAGGIVDSETIESQQGRDGLADNDAYGVLEQAGALIRTGPTGTNVNDLRIVVIPAVDSECEPRRRSE